MTKAQLVEQLKGIPSKATVECTDRGLTFRTGDIVWAIYMPKPQARL